jgi:hypothetical protein
MTVWNSAIVGGIGGASSHYFTGDRTASVETAQTVAWKPTRNTIRPDRGLSAEDLDAQQPSGGGATARKSTRTPTATGASWSYRNCKEARAAGAAPIYRGQPGYGAHMDGDGDGIACEPYHGR